MRAPDLADRLAIIAAAVTGAIRALAAIGFKFGVIELRIVPHQSPIDAT